MPPDWQLRNALATAILGRRDEALRPVAALDRLASAAPDEAGAAALGVFFLHFLSFMLRRVGEKPQSELLRPSEAGTYTALLAVLDGAGVSGRFAELQRRVLAALAKIKSQVAEGSLPLSLGHLLVGDPKRALSSFSWKRPLDDAERRLATLLSLQGVLYDKTDEPLTTATARLPHEVAVLHRRLFADAASHDPRRIHPVLSILFWGRIALLDRRGSDGRLVLDDWWPLLETLRTIEPPDASSRSAFLAEEPEILINLMRLLGEIDTVRGGPGTRAGRPADRVDADQLGGLDELYEHAERILRERMEALSADLAAADHAALPLATLYAGLRSLLDYHGRVLGPAVRRLGTVEKALRARQQVALDPDGSLFPDSPAWQSFHRQCENIKQRITLYAQSCLKASDRAKLRPFLLLVVGQPGTGKSQFVETARRALQSALAPAQAQAPGVEKNLSQALSTADELSGVWSELAAAESLGPTRDVHFVVLDEFDSLVDEQPTQYRHVLAPLWMRRPAIRAAATRCGSDRSWRSAS